MAPIDPEFEIGVREQLVEPGVEREQREIDLQPFVRRRAGEEGDVAELRRAVLGMGVAVGEITLLRGVDRRQPLVQLRLRHRTVDDEGGGSEQYAVEAPAQIGRAEGRERVCQYVEMSVVAVSYK